MFFFFIKRTCKIHLSFLNRNYTWFIKLTLLSRYHLHSLAWITRSRFMYAAQVNCVLIVDGSFFKCIEDGHPLVHAHKTATEMARTPIRIETGFELFQSIPILSCNAAGVTCVLIVDGASLSALRMATFSSMKTKPQLKWRSCQ